jgi:hypothetical protein
MKYLLCLILLHRSVHVGDKNMKTETHATDKTSKTIKLTVLHRSLRYFYIK